MRLIRAKLFLGVLALVLCVMPSPYCHSADLKEAVQLMKQGQQLVDKARYREAVDVFKKMEASCGANEECHAAALFWIGRSYVELSQFTEAQP